MKLTNKYGLPKALVNYARSNKYSRGAADYSATTLIGSPRQFFLFKKHGKEVVKDISDNIFSLLGTAVHSILEEGAHFDCVTEERLYTEVNGKTISGQIDVQEFLSDGTTKISDFKTSSVWSAIIDGGVKDDWEKQVNIYAELVERNKNVLVSEAEIVVFYRDWTGREVGKKQGYPQRPIMAHPVRIWPKEDRERYLGERVDAFVAAQEMADQDEYPLCSDEDRWVRNKAFAIMKHGRKTALRILGSEADAEQWLSANITPGHHAQHYIEERKKQYTRCEKYCDVAPFCSQYKAEKILDQIDLEE